MKTLLVIQKGWQVIREYDFQVYLNKGDSVEFEGVEYLVKGRFLDLDKGCMNILIEL